MKLHHFILTRFNLPLWREDKHGRKIDRRAWLEERLNLFEKYCLPSMLGQSCGDYRWILLCDEETPVEYRGRINGYRDVCPQIELVQVEREYAWDFPEIFGEIVTSMLEEVGAMTGDMCITSLLDNDDALHKDYVANVQEMIKGENISFGPKNNQPFFLSFDYGLQLFADMKMATKVVYPNNHFLSCIEPVNIFPIRTCFGYGSHFLLEKRGFLAVHHVKDAEKPMWVEVIHGDNVDNDVKMTLDTTIVRDSDMLHRDFGVDTTLEIHSIQYAFRWLGQLTRRAKGKVVSRKWKK